MKVNSRFRDQLRAALERAAPEGEIARILFAMERETQLAVAGVLLLLFAASADGLQTQVAGMTGLSVPQEIVREDGQRWAGERAVSFARAAASNTADAIRETLAQVRQTVTTSATDARELVETRLERLFGSSRAEAAAVTETTSGVTAGEAAVRNRYAEQGVKLEFIWQTEADLRVCPVCNPLHDLREHEWRARQPGGPPAHPKCRCWLQVRSAA